MMSVLSACCNSFTKSKKAVRIASHGFSDALITSLTAAVEIHNKNHDDLISKCDTKLKEEKIMNSTCNSKKVRFAPLNQTIPPTYAEVTRRGLEKRNTNDNRMNNAHMKNISSQ